MCSGLFQRDVEFSIHAVGFVMKECACDFYDFTSKSAHKCLTGIPISLGQKLWKETKAIYIYI